jgi:hypothetical protein
VVTQNKASARVSTRRKMQKNSSGDETEGFDDDYIGFHS